MSVDRFMTALHRGTAEGFTPEIEQELIDHAPAVELLLARPQSPSASNPVEDGLVDELRQLQFRHEYMRPRVRRLAEQALLLKLPQIIAALEAANVSALQADVERLKAKLELILHDATNNNSAPGARLARIRDYARAALRGDDA